MKSALRDLPFLSPVPHDEEPDPPSTGKQKPCSTSEPGYYSSIACTLSEHLNARRWPLKGGKGTGFVGVPKRPENPVTCFPVEKRLTTFCASLCSYKMCSLCTPSGDGGTASVLLLKIRTYPQGFAHIKYSTSFSFPHTAFRCVFCTLPLELVGQRSGTYLPVPRIPARLTLSIMFPPPFCKLESFAFVDILFFNISRLTGESQYKHVFTRKRTLHS